MLRDSVVFHFAGFAVPFGQLAALTERAVAVAEALLAALSRNIAALPLNVPEQRAVRVTQALDADASGSIARGRSTATIAVLEAPHAHPMVGVAERCGRGTLARLVRARRGAHTRDWMADARRCTAVGGQAIATSSGAGLAIGLRVPRLDGRGRRRVRRCFLHGLLRWSRRGIGDVDRADSHGVARRLKQPQLLRLAPRHAVRQQAREQEQRRYAPNQPRHSAPSAISRASWPAYPFG